MRKFVFITVLIVFAAGLVPGLYADPGIKVLKVRPEEGTYSEVGELRLQMNQVNDDASMAELQRQAKEMGADAIVLFNTPAAGESLVMTENRTIAVGVAIKYE